VRQGDIFAITGNTGKITTNAHLHHDISINKINLNDTYNFYDPQEYFKPVTLRIKVITEHEWVRGKLPVVSEWVNRLSGLMLDIIFDVEIATKRPAWVEDKNMGKIISSKYVKSQLTDSEYDICVWHTENNWQSSYGGYSDISNVEKYLTYFIAMKAAEDGLRRGNKDEFTTRLEHEIAHCLLDMHNIEHTNTVHYYDYTKDRLGDIFRLFTLTRPPEQEEDLSLAMRMKNKLFKHRDKPAVYYSDGVKIAWIENVDKLRFGESAGWWNIHELVVITDDITHDLIF
jgi:hypothetical protein